MYNICLGCKYPHKKCIQITSTSGGSINRKLDCSARFGPSSDQSNLPSIARSLPNDNENEHDETAAILKDTFDWQDTLVTHIWSGLQCIISQNQRNW